MNLLCFSGKYSPNSSLNYVSDMNQLIEPFLQVKFLVDRAQNSIIVKHLDQSILNQNSTTSALKPFSRAKNIASKDSKTLLSISASSMDNDSTTPVLAPNLETFLKEIYNHSKTKYASLSVASRRRKLSALKNFSLWCLDNDLIQNDPLKSVPSSKLPERLPEYLNLDEIMVYFKSLLADYNSEPAKYKNELINFLVLYGCGLRTEEACTIQVKSIDWSNSRITIIGKGNKERFAILPEFVKDKLSSLILNGDEFIYGEKPLGTRTAYNWIKKRGLKAGLHKPVHPHMFRHTYATHLLREKTDLRHLQELLGHSSLVATQRYTHLDKNQLLQSLEDFHPLSKEKIEN